RETVDGAVAVVVDVVADLRCGGAGRAVVGARGAGSLARAGAGAAGGREAVDGAVAVVVDVVALLLGGRAGRAAVHTRETETVANAGADAARRDEAVHGAIAVVVHVVAQLSCTGVDGGIAVVAVGLAAVRTE